MEPALERTLSSTVVYTSLSSEQIKGAVEQGYAWVGGLAELRNVTNIDLPPASGRCGRASGNSPG
jgi:hypothetical protein